MKKNDMGKKNFIALMPNDSDANDSLLPEMNR